MSLRNMNIDAANTKLNDLFHLHKYDECVLFINRLSHLTIKLLIPQLSTETFLSRLPYTIEIFEALYSKVFIMDPDDFPSRFLQPDRLIDKMISYFSLLADHAKLEPIDGARIIESFENVIRIISYVQPNIYSRLLYFKYAIDNGLLKLKRDLSANNAPQSGKEDDLLRKYMPTNLVSALMISRASNLQLCETMKNELSQTVAKCEKAAQRLNAYISDIKSQKIFKDAQYYIHNLEKKEKKEANAAQRLDDDINEMQPVVCQDYVQNRLFLNKSLMNAIDPHLGSIRLHKMMTMLGEKIELDKEILLVFSHIKREEKYLSIHEPLQPLLRRYSLGYERVIQIWRKKCCGDSLVAFGTRPVKVCSDMNIDNAGIYRHSLYAQSQSSALDCRNLMEKSFSGI